MIQLNVLALMRPVKAAIIVNLVAIVVVVVGWSSAGSRPHCVYIRSTCIKNTIRNKGAAKGRKNWFSMEQIDKLDSN